MSQLLHVVVAINGTDSSKDAFNWALKHLLSPAQHRVTLITVVEPPSQTGYYYAASAAMYTAQFVDDVYKRATEEATETVRTFQKRLEEHFQSKMQCEMIVGRGEVRDEIADYVESSKADLLVLGSRDLGALKRAEALRTARFSASAETSRFEELTRERAARRLASAKFEELNGPQPFVPTCLDKCPEFERYEREIHFDLSAFEMLDENKDRAATTGTGLGEYPRVDHRKAVKKYHRPAAGNEAPLPEDVRPPRVLLATMDYLLDQVITQVNQSVPFAEIHNFVRDRTRAIRQDLTIQGCRDEMCVLLHEQMARFHILSNEWLIEEGREVFDAFQNTEQLRKVLQSLHEFYTDSYQARKRKGAADATPHHANEPEFRAYYILTHLRDSDVFRQASSLPFAVYNSEDVQFALACASAFHQRNYIRFFGLVRGASYLSAALLQTHFIEMRRRALELLNRVMAPGEVIPLDDLQRWLAFIDKDEAVECCRYYGFEVDYGGVRFFKDRSMIAPNEPLKQRRARALILSKMTAGIVETVRASNAAASLSAAPASATMGWEASAKTTRLEQAKESFLQDVAVGRPCEKEPVSGRKTVLEALAQDMLNALLYSVAGLELAQIIGNVWIGEHARHIKSVCDYKLGMAQQVFADLSAMTVAELVEPIAKLVFDRASKERQLDLRTALARTISADLARTIVKHVAIPKIRRLAHKCLAAAKYRQRLALVAMAGWHAAHRRRLMVREEDGRMKARLVELRQALGEVSFALPTSHTHKSTALPSPSGPQPFPQKDRTIAPTRLDLSPLDIPTLVQQLHPDQAASFVSFHLRIGLGEEVAEGGLAAFLKTKLSRGPVGSSEDVWSHYRCVLSGEKQRGRARTVAVQIIASRNPQTVSSGDCSSLLVVQANFESEPRFLERVEQLLASMDCLWSVSIALLSMADVAGPVLAKRFSRHKDKFTSIRHFRIGGRDSWSRTVQAAIEFLISASATLPQMGLVGVGELLEPVLQGSVYQPLSAAISRMHVDRLAMRRIFGRCWRLLVDGICRLFDGAWIQRHPACALSSDSVKGFLRLLGEAGVQEFSAVESQDSHGVLAMLMLEAYDRMLALDKEIGRVPLIGAGAGAAMAAASDSCFRLLHEIAGNKDPSLALKQPKRARRETTTLEEVRSKATGLCVASLSQQVEAEHCAQADFEHMLHSFCS